MRDAQGLGAERSARWVGVSEASRLLGVHPPTVRQWTDQGRLPAFLTPGGHRRYREADLQAFHAQPLRDWPGRSLATALLTVQPRCGLSGTLASQTYPWLSRCDEADRQRLRLLGGALVRLLARYVTADDSEAARCLDQACEDAAEYGALALELGLSPAAVIEAFTVCRAPIVAAGEGWARQATAGAPEVLDTLARVSRFFDATLSSMVRALEHPPKCAASQVTVP